MNNQTKSQRKAKMSRKTRMHWFVKEGNSLGETRCKKVLGPIRKIRFTKSTPRQANMQEMKGPSHGKLQVKHPHQRSRCAVKFEDRSQEETERQQRCARSKAWKLAKNIYKLREKDKATFYSALERMGTPGCVNKRAGRKRVCGRFRSKYAYGQQARPKLR